MPIDRFVDSILDYFRLPEHKKNAPPGVGARVEQTPGQNPQATSQPVPIQHPAQAPPIEQKSPTAPPISTPATDAPGARPAQAGQPNSPAPVAQPAAPSEARPVASSHEQLDVPIRILLVEDDPKWAKLVNAYIAAINGERTLGLLELDWVETLEAALSKVGKNSYDLVFLDLMLPDSQGIHTLESVWAQVSKVKSPVVVMSNLDSGGVMDRVREVTGRDILLKKNISKKVLFGHIDSNVFEDDL